MAENQGCLPWRCGYSFSPKKATLGFRTTKLAPANCTDMEGPEMLFPSASLCPRLLTISVLALLLGTELPPAPAPPPAPKLTTETLPQAEVTEEGRFKNFAFLSEGNQSQPALRSAGLSQTFPRILCVFWGGRFLVTVCLIMF